MAKDLKHRKLYQGLMNGHVVVADELKADYITHATMIMGILESNANFDEFLEYHKVEAMMLTILAKKC